MKGTPLSVTSAPFSLQLKPVGSECNIACNYECYVEPFKGRFKSVMKLDVLEKILISFLKGGDDLAISWHGGEPTLAGLDFFKNALNIIAKNKRDTQKIRHYIQTNATTITPAFAEFFAENGFFVSVSLDGPEEIHGIHRVNKKGSNTHWRVIRGLGRLKAAGINPQVICTVTTVTIEYAEVVFNYLVELGFKLIKYSPVFDGPGNTNALDNDEWYGYLRRVFHAWLELSDPSIQIRELDEVIAWLRKDKIASCSSDRTCLSWTSVDPDGNLYPCEYLKTDLPYGNIHSKEIGDIGSSLTYKTFEQSILHIPDKCKVCEFYEVCGNGCSANRLDENSNPSLTGVYVFCEERKMLFKEIESVFSSILNEGEVRVPFPTVIRR